MRRHTYRKYILQTFLAHRLGFQSYARLLAQGRRPGYDNAGSHGALKKGEQIMLQRFMGIKYAFAGAEEMDGTVHNALPLPDGVGVRNDPQTELRMGN
jgi:hypothetical protein